MEKQEQIQNHPSNEFVQQYECVEGEAGREETDLADATIEVKVSGDCGITWSRRKINLGGEVDESGLEKGEIFQVNGEKYKVIEGDFGLTIEPMRKPTPEKRAAKKSKR